VVSPRPTDPEAPFYEPAHALKPTKVIRFRQRGESECRYIRLFGRELLPINRVIVGPSRFQSLNYQRVSDLVGSDIEIVNSETPFLG
jgi:hypothetical protein